jgi:Holliday junction resolvase-like predicted endonuclease
MIKKYLKETVEVLEYELKNAKKLYNSSFINWKGKTLDSKEYYTEVISRELLKAEKLVLLGKIDQINRVNYNVDTHDGKHNGDTNRAEEIFAMQLKGKKLKKLGLVIDYQVSLKEKRSDDAGKIDLITSASEYVYIVELKYIGNKETLLRAILEIWTYYKQLNKVNFLKSFKLLKKNKIEDIRKAVLLSVDCNAYNEAKELSKRPKLKQLAKALGIDIFLLEENITIIEL